MIQRSVWQRLAIGVAAGLAGTVAIQGLQAIGQHVRPQSMPPLRQDPGEFMIQKVEEHIVPALRRRISPPIENIAAQSLALGYGATCGALYAALRPQVQSLLGDGTVLGVVTWAAGYVGWLPATGLMPPITRHTGEQILGAVAGHILFGITTVGLYRFLHQAV
jgi:hypothetical protein